VQPIGRWPVTADRSTADVRDQQLVIGPPAVKWALGLSTFAFSDLPQLSSLVFDDSAPEIIGAAVSSGD
jgi:hypothetical protein